MMKKDQRGSALVWALALMMIIVAFLGFIVPAAASSITSSQRSNQKQQAYYTAKSVAEMVAEYIVSDTTIDPGKSILEKAKTADPDDGNTWTVTGLKEGMGKCDVNVRYSEGVLYIKAMATYGEETQQLSILLKQEENAGNFQSAESYVSGYDGIRAKTVYGINEENKDTLGESLKMVSGNLLISNGKEEEDTIDLNPRDVKMSDRHSAISLRRDDSGKTTKYFSGGPLLYTDADIFEENEVTGDAMASLISKGNIVFSNEKNLFRFRPNFVSPYNRAKYCLYSLKTIKLVGQIELPYQTIDANLTTRNLILEGRKVDENNDLGIPEGVTINNYNFYIKDTISLDYATLSMRAGRPLIYGDGPMYITNQYGPTLIDGSYNTTNGLVNCTGVYITCEKEHKVQINGTVLVYTEKPKLTEIDNYIKKEKEKDASFDDEPYIEHKDVYKGNVEIDGGTGEGVEIKGNIYADGDVTIKGNVKVDGYISGKNIVVEGDGLKCETGLYPYQSFSYKNKEGVETKLNRSDTPIKNSKNGMGRMLYNSDTDQYDFTYYQNLSSSDQGKANKSYSVTFGTDTNIFAQNIELTVGAADKDSPRTIKDIPLIQTVSASKANNVIELRNSENAYHAYEYTTDANLGEMTINSYGDVYIIIGKNKTVSIDSIKSDFFIGNLYFIVRDGGKLRLNDVNNTENQIIEANIYTEDGGTVQIGDKTEIHGVIDVDRLILGKDVSYTFKELKALSGGVSKGKSKWNIVQYVDGK